MLYSQSFVFIAYVYFDIFLFVNVLNTLVPVFFSPKKANAVLMEVTYHFGLAFSF